jgi:hypothetical protein
MLSALENLLMSEVRLLTFQELPWSAGLVLIAAGIVLLVCGSRWRDFTEVLSTSFLAGAAALVTMPAVPVNPVWPAVAVCLAAGFLTILFRRAALVVLSGAVLAVALTLAAHLVCGWSPVQYVVASLSNSQVLTLTTGPDYFHSPLLLTLAAAGLLGGALLALLCPAWARRVTMALEGGLALVAGLALVTAEFFSRPLPPGYPMNYYKVGVAVWFGLAALGVLAQLAADNSDRTANCSPRKESP